ncbi:MAG: acyltransferase [Flavobacteriales bacterium]|nr:acyltransferase [Flavobacteriales bacterium]
MPRNKRLHFKDLDALRFFGFIPIFVYCFLKLLTFDKEGITYEIANAIEFITKNCLDFFFFLSSFLISSHILREVKYRKKFSFKNYIIRRFLRVSTVLVLALLFIFLLHPWLIEKLKLQAISIPEGWSYVMLLPNYFYDARIEQYVYLIVVWAVFMFIQFYFVWGLLLYFLVKYLKYVSFAVIGIGIVARIVHLQMDVPWEFDTLSYGVAIGIGGLAALLVRQEHWSVQKIKGLSKNIIWVIYISGILFLLLAYYLSYDNLLTAFVPIISCAFFAFLVIEQTYAKNSIYKFRNNKLISHLGKISYGMIIYQGIINVLVMTAIGSLDFDLRSDLVKIVFFLISFILTWIVADLSYNMIEKPLLIFRKEFKKV